MALKDLRNRIAAIKSTEKITSAMKMVAAARLRKVQDLLMKSATYRDNLYTSAGRLLSVLEREAEEKGQLLEFPKICNRSKEDKQYLLVVLSSDRGLCGSYNVMIARTAVKRIEELKAAGKDVKIICLGIRCYNILKRNYKDIIIRNADSLASGGVSYGEAVALAEELRGMFENGEIDSCEVVYSRFESAITRDTSSYRILPFDLSGLYETLPSDREGDAFYEAEPNNKDLFNDLIPLVFKELIFHIMINAQASEQSARMTSMENATKNAEDIISKLTLKYNRLRQAAITTELVEIIAGAEAV